MQYAPYRIERPSPIRAQAAGSAAEDKAAQYVERLARLVPAEVLGLYLTFRGLTAPPPSGSEPGRDAFALAWPVVCLVLVFLSRIWGSRPRGTPLSRALSTAQWPVVVISTISFVLWVYATGDNFFHLTIEDPRWIGASVGVWTMLVPWLYRGTEQ